MASPRHGPDGRTRSSWSASFSGYAGSPRSNGGEDGVVVVEHGEHEDVDVGTFGDPPGGVDAVHAPGHLQVHHDDVRDQVDRDGHRLLAGGRLADDVEVAGRGEQRAQAAAEDRMVVGEDDRGGGGGGVAHETGSVATTRVPPPTPGSIDQVPPSSSARWRIDRARRQESGSPVAPHRRR